MRPWVFRLAKSGNDKLSAATGRRSCGGTHRDATDALRCLPKANSNQLASVMLGENEAFMTKATPSAIPDAISSSHPDEAFFERLMSAREAALDDLFARGKWYAGIKRPKGYEQGAEKQCFYNSQMLALDGRGRYVEGVVYCHRSGRGFHHGWITLDGKRAIDVTLDVEAHTYFGVKFPTRIIKKRMAESGYCEPILDLNLIVYRTPPGGGTA
jgi:hypothetical protein